MTLAGALRKSRYATPIRRRAQDYAESPVDPAGRSRVQLELLNREWERVTRLVPHYAALCRSGGLPVRFGSLQEFAERVPVVTRSDVKRGMAAMTSAGPAPDFHRMTGGSTAEPVRLPAWSSENDATRPDLWLGRGWYGVDPGSKLFLLWGHSHLLGSGARGRLKGIKVKASDRMLGYRRFSAYDLRPEKLEEAARALLAHRPDYVIGYSVALDLFARVNARRAPELRALNLRAVIATAESFPSPDSATRLSDLLGCPVAMEYGSVETWLMAHTHPAGGYRVFWRSHLLQTVPGPTGRRVLVTSLYPRCFPLVRYDMGDDVELAVPTPEGEGLAEIVRVVGRCNDTVTLSDGAVIHSEVFTHAVRPCAEVAAYQVVQSGGAIRIDYLAAAPLDAAREEDIRGRLGRVHPELRQVPLRRVDALERTIAGKTPMVVRRVAP